MKRNSPHAATIEAFCIFARHSLLPPKRDRYLALLRTQKGRKNLLETLSHEFKHAIRPNTSQGKVNREIPCFAFHFSLDFGEEFSSIDEAYDKLSLTDAWLILAADGSGAIHRPEADWDAEIEIIS